MEIARKSYPSDVSDDEWALIAPYLTLLPEDAGQRDYPLREAFNGLRYIIKTGVVQNQPFSGYTGARKQPVHESRFWFESCPLPEARDSPGQAR